MTKTLDSLKLPDDLRGLDLSQLEQLAKEVREELIESVAASGGHFASSLGATEIAVALHHMFNTPHDKIVWDVGHQAYVHKMLTGRRPRLPSIRKKGGLSGFLRRDESPYDSFGAGHAGTSISAAVGMATAFQRHRLQRFQGDAVAASDSSTPAPALDDTPYVVAVIGDGSMTCGMAFEALNHAGDLGLNRLIVVLNDNEMSISPNVGAISWLFSLAKTSHASNIARSNVKGLYRRGYMPDWVYKTLDRAEEAAQGFFATPGKLFESFGFRYIGPVNGHSIEDLVCALRHAKEQDVPVLIHAHTVKGKGYEPAEGDPIKWHGVVPFDRERGEFLAHKSAGRKSPSFTAVFAQTLIDVARADPRVVGISAAMAGGTGLDKLQAALPEQFYDVGICEQHAVTFAAGLACEGLKPVCAIYSTFLQRAYDQVVHDVCIQNLPVVFALDRGGLVGNDGETHHGVFDLAFLRTLPNIILLSPKDENELQHMLATCLEHPGPSALRFPRGNGIGVELDPHAKALEIGKAEVLRGGSEVLIIGYGPVVQYALQAAERVEAELDLSVAVINARFAKPLDETLLLDQLPRYHLVCTLEDHALSAGFGSAILECVNDNGLRLQAPIERFGVGDHYVSHASQEEQHSTEGYDAESLVAFLRAWHSARVAEMEPRSSASLLPNTLQENAQSIASEHSLSPLKVAC